MTNSSVAQNLVFVTNDELTTTSITIAAGTGNDHASVIKLVRTYQSDLEGFGFLGFEIQEKRGTKGAPTEYAILNERQATLLISYMRNSEIVRAFKMRLVKQFYEMAEKLKAVSRDQELRDREAYLAEQQAKWDLSRWYTRNGYKKMMAALEQQNPLISPDQLNRLKWSEANLLNYTLVGINNHDFGYWFKTDSVRDCLAVPQIDAMDYLQAMNTSLILSDVDYAARSEILSKTLERQFPTCKAYKDYLVRLIAYRLETVQYHLKPIAPKDHEIFNPFVRIGTTPNNLMGRHDA